MPSSSSLLLTLLVLFSFSYFCVAKEILVGGKTDSWKVPSSESDSLNHWAQSARFRIGDSLVWKSNVTKDSVLQVTKGYYISCNTTNPIAEHKEEDGETTKVKLDRSGPFYFISGVKGHCEKGQKLIVVVLSPRRLIATSPAPSPAEFDFDGLVVAPTSIAATDLNNGGFVGVLVGALTILGFALI